MAFSRTTTPSTATPFPLKFNPLGMELCLSLMTVPVLTSLVLGSATLKAVKYLGELTESGLHRDRLPTLTLPEPDLNP